MATPSESTSTSTNSSTRYVHKPRIFMPCANAEPKTGGCKQRGTNLCSGCRLVSYCSKKCQGAHWKLHKIDCRNKLRSDDWRPQYIVEGRKPTITNPKSPEIWPETYNETDPGNLPYLKLWGDRPAMDFLRIQDNEKDLKKDLTVALVGPNDLRDVVETVNNLPEDYTGRLTVILSDRDVMAVCRQAMTLLALATQPDAIKAADTALHFWYSAFLPSSYHETILALLDDYRISLQCGLLILLGTTSGLQTGFPVQHLAEFYQSMQIDAASAKKSYVRARTNAAKKDMWDNWYFHVKGSHRVASEKYLRDGIVLPFGAPTDAFDAANGSLFNPLTKAWEQSDIADPLSSYPIADVVAAGKKHDVPPEDIYGCLYFYLLARLVKFKRRLSKFRVLFRLTRILYEPRMAQEVHLDTPYLISDMFSPDMLSSSGRVVFDRVVVYGLCDEKHFGISPVLEAWGRVLDTRNKHSVILASFRRWTQVERDGMLESSPVKPEDREKESTKAMHQGVNMQPEWVQTNVTHMGLSESQQHFEIRNIVRTCHAFYNTYPAFQRYLESQHVERVLLRTRLKMRTVNKVWPNRIGVPPGEDQNALPDLGDDPQTALYYALRLDRQSLWTERFVEFTRA